MGYYQRVIRFDHGNPMRALIVLSLSLLFGVAVAADDPAFDYLQSRQLRSITVEGQDLPVLVRPWEGKKQHGAAIIFADTGFGPDAPGLVAYLRSGLSPTGWASISMTPPKSPPHPSFTTAPEEITKAGEGQLSTPAAKAMEKYKPEEWQKHVETQLGFVEASLTGLTQIGAAYPGKRILVAMDRSAALILSLLNDGKVAPPDLLVIINPYSSSPEFDDRLPGLVAVQEVPVLDIQSPDGNSASLANAPLRRAAASAKDGMQYRQLTLSLNISEPDAWAEVLSALRGFAASIKETPPQ